MIELKITAASADELVEKLVHLADGFVAKVNTDSQPASNDDPYGDGNGPVAVVVPSYVENNPYYRRAKEAADVTTETLVDDRGVVWDERFHASTKTKTTAGAWKKRKGADADELAAYENQYLNPPTADEAPEAPSGSAPVMPQTEPAPAPAPAAMPQAEAAPAPAAMPEVEAAPAATPPGPEVMTFASKIISEGKKTPDYLSEVARRCGMSNIGELFNDETKRKAFVEALAEDGFPYQ
jgi:hypothetical protein